MEVPSQCVPYVATASRQHLLLGLLLGALVIAAATLLLLFLVPRPLTLYMTAPLHRTVVLTPQRHAPSPMRLASSLAQGGQGQGQGQGGRDYLMIPAVFSVADEGYIIRMRLGSDNVLVVLDSGSANLSVGTAECVKDSLCSAHDGAYRPDASPDAVDMRQSVNLQYASLTMDAQWWQDSAALPFISGCPPKRALALEDVQTEVRLPALLPIAAARRMDGTASNILGLMGSHSGQGELPVLEHMLAALELPRRWALVAHANGAGCLVLGNFPSHCFPGVQLKHVPMSTAFRYMGAPCVDVVRMRWRDARGWHTIPHDAIPKHAVLDTGCAESYTHASSAHMFENVVGLPPRDTKLHRIDALPDVEVTLANGLTVVYGPQQYMVPATGGGFRSTFHCGDATVDALFGGAPVFLIGIHHMSGWVLDVDLQRERVGFGRLPQ